MQDSHTMKDTCSPTVQQMHALNLTGNVTPKLWYKNILLDSGKPDHIAIMLLAEFCYWYRPKELRDEKTGRFIGYVNRFAADKLQRSYSSLEADFGIPRETIRKTLYRMRTVYKVITTETRNIMVAGKQLYNVLFIEVNPERIDYYTNEIEVSENELPGNEKQENRGGMVAQYHTYGSTLPYPMVAQYHTYTESINTKTITDIKANFLPKISPEKIRNYLLLKSGKDIPVNNENKNNPVFDKTNKNNDNPKNSGENPMRCSDPDFAKRLQSVMPKKAERKPDSKVKINELSLLWKRRFSDEQKAFTGELTQKQVGQLKAVLRDYPMSCLELVNFVFDNWVDFAQRAMSDNGLNNYPGTVNLGFFSAYRLTAETMRLEADNRPVKPVTPAPVTEVNSTDEFLAMMGSPK